MTKPQPVLILASASPRRRELLAGLGLEFEVMPAEIAEHEAIDSDPRKLVRHNAALKADWVAARQSCGFCSLWPGCGRDTCRAVPAEPSTWWPGVKSSTFTSEVPMSMPMNMMV